MRPSLIALFFILFSTELTAGQTALVGGRLIDGYGGRPLTDSVVLIKDDRIVEVGTVTPGKKADIIAVRGDVLKHMNILSDVDLVMKDGVIYKRDGRPAEKRLR